MFNNKLSYFIGLPHSEAKVQIFCENEKPESINCKSPNDTINVISARYKTIDANHCPVKNGVYPPAGVDCDVKNVSDSVADECNGNDSCTPRVSDDDHGDPCSNIFAYYLYIEYECIPESQTGMILTW